MTFWNRSPGASRRGYVSEGAVPHLDLFENKPQLASFVGALFFAAGAAALGSEVGLPDGSRQKDRRPFTFPPGMPAGWIN